MERSCDPLPAGIRNALELVHERDQRVVELLIDGQLVAVPFALVLYLCGHGPYDKPRIWECKRRNWVYSITVREQRSDDVLIWPISKERNFDHHSRAVNDDGDWDD